MSEPTEPERLRADKTRLLAAQKELLSQLAEVRADRDRLNAENEKLATELREMLEYFGNPRPIEWATAEAYAAALEVCKRAAAALGAAAPEGAKD